MLAFRTIAATMLPAAAAFAILMILLRVPPVQRLLHAARSSQERQ